MLSTCLPKLGTPNLAIVIVLSSYYCHAFYLSYKDKKKLVRLKIVLICIESQTCCVLHHSFSYYDVDFSLWRYISPQFQLITYYFTTVYDGFRHSLRMSFRVALRASTEVAIIPFPDYA